jgi:phage FluMu gp28-like protein
MIFVCLLSLNTMAAKKDRYEYEDCLLEHLDHAKIDVASRFIAEACEENYGSGPSTSVMSNERKYNECLLEHMVGVESIDAVIRIRRACEKKFR